MIVVYEREGYVGKWAVEESVCDHCGTEWVSVHAFPEYLQCPVCQKNTPAIVEVPVEGD